ncbi:hypothetical protein DFA_01417 [Cavenderia fasciculata]|uniref:Uncharacterized protein n=1 Tax=Cavenderia fasciculata TaxID=261658 RepID=F4PSQ3_CACFS|nr:uncharacterized protein DFA_01417 [Cavenderia fasciculata]EGG21531.1 hypothetical protein DFA_01417 [Cavenderia fasciculata]|eukprot:XP_004359381.1 hypothetical protein DFA_01417 [Cavenderia fasciculata]
MKITDIVTTVTRSINIDGFKGISAVVLDRLTHLTMKDKIVCGSIIVYSLLMAEYIHDRDKYCSVFLNDDEAAKQLLTTMYEKTVNYTAQVLDNAPQVKGLLALMRDNKSFAKRLSKDPNVAMMTYSIFVTQSVTFSLLAKQLWSDTKINVAYFEASYLFQEDLKEILLILCQYCPVELIPWDLLRKYALANDNAWSVRIDSVEMIASTIINRGGCPGDTTDGAELSLALFYSFIESRFDQSSPQIRLAAAILSNQLLAEKGQDQLSLKVLKCVNLYSDQKVSIFGAKNILCKEEYLLESLLSVASLACRFTTPLSLFGAHVCKKISLSLVGLGSNLLTRMISVPFTVAIPEMALYLFLCSGNPLSYGLIFITKRLPFQLCFHRIYHNPKKRMNLLYAIYQSEQKKIKQQQQQKQSEQVQQTEQQQLQPEQQ